MTPTINHTKKLRKAHRAELKDIVALANKTFSTFYRPFLGDHNVDWYVNSGELKREIVKHVNDLYILELNSEIKGFIIYFDNFIHIMMVDEDAHRAGMGTYMLAAVEKVLFKKNETIKLQSFANNDIATKFYLKNGWTKGDVNVAHNNVAMMYFEKSK